MTINCGHTEVEFSDTTEIILNGTTYVICDECAESVDAEFGDTFPVCNDCGVNVAEYGDSFDVDCVMDSIVARYDGVRLTIGGSVLSAEYGTHEFGSEGLCVCSSCEENYAWCDSCEETIRRDDSNYCEDCDATYCNDWSCDDSHNNCNYSGGASMTIADSLARPANAGKVVRSTRAVGCEIERDGGSSRAAAADLQRAGVLYESHGEHCGHEFVLLPMRGTNLENGLRETFRILADHGFTENDDCGAHFHLDMSQESPQSLLRIVAGLRIVENVLFALTEDANGEKGGRRFMSWCKPTANVYTTTILDNVRRSELADPFGSGWNARLSYAVGQDDRYAAINCLAHSEHSTIEIRLYEGILDVDRYLLGIALATGIADFASQATAATMAACIDNPLALIYRAAREGFVSGAVMSAVEEYYAEISGEIRAMAVIEAARQEAMREQESIRQAYAELSRMARDSYNSAIAPAQEEYERIRAAAAAVTAAARAAYDAALSAQYRIEDAARQSMDSATASERNAYAARSAAIREQEYAEMSYVVVPDLPRRNSAARATARRYICCEACG